MTIANDAKQPDDIVFRSSGLYYDAMSLGYFPTFRKTVVLLVSRPQDSDKIFLLGLLMFEGGDATDVAASLKTRILCNIFAGKRQMSHSEIKLLWKNKRHCNVNIIARFSCYKSKVQAYGCCIRYTRKRGGLLDVQEKNGGCPTRTVRHFNAIF